MIFFALQMLTFVPGVIIWGNTRFKKSWNNRICTVLMIIGFMRVFQRLCSHCGNHFCSKCCSHKVPRSLFGATCKFTQLSGSIYFNSFGLRGVIFFLAPFLCWSYERILKLPSVRGGWCIAENNWTCYCV